MEAEGFSRQARDDQIRWACIRPVQLWGARSPYCPPPNLPIGSLLPTEADVGLSLILVEKTGDEVIPLISRCRGRSIGKREQASGYIHVQALLSVALGLLDRSLCNVLLLAYVEHAPIKAEQAHHPFVPLTEPFRPSHPHAFFSSKYIPSVQLPPNTEENGLTCKRGGRTRYNHPIPDPGRWGFLCRPFCSTEHPGPLQRTGTAVWHPHRTKRERCHSECRYCRRYHHRRRA